MCVLSLLCQQVKNFCHIIYYIRTIFIILPFYWHCNLKLTTVACNHQINSKQFIGEIYFKSDIKHFVFILPEDKVPCCKFILQSSQSNTNYIFLYEQNAQLYRNLLLIRKLWHHRLRISSIGAKLRLPVGGVVLL